MDRAATRRERLMLFDLAMLTRTLVPLALLTACTFGRGADSSPSSSQTTSAQKYGAGSTDLRTVDNTGYVDPGGRTREVNASGTSTMGRGNTVVAPPRRESPGGSAATSEGESAGEMASRGSETGAGSETAPSPLASTSADPSEFTERAARALCDRETYCGRIGARKSFESADACLATKRERVRAAMNEGSCRELRSESISRCLTAIRGAACGGADVPLQPPPACRADVLCQ